MDGGDLYTKKLAVLGHRGSLPQYHLEEEYIEGHHTSDGITICKQDSFRCEKIAFNSRFFVSNSLQKKPTPAAIKVVIT
jgi:hypothetical protein